VKDALTAAVGFEDGGRRHKPRHVESLWMGRASLVCSQQGNRDFSPPVARDCILPTAQISLEIHSPYKPPESNSLLQHLYFKPMKPGLGL
jgi:hypothetical protein